MRSHLCFELTLDRLLHARNGPWLMIADHFDCNKRLLFFNVSQADVKPYLNIFRWNK